MRAAAAAAAAAAAPQKRRITCSDAAIYRRSRTARTTEYCQLPLLVVKAETIKDSSKFLHTSLQQNQRLFEVKQNSIRPPHILFFKQLPVRKVKARPHQSRASTVPVSSTASNKKIHSRVNRAETTNEHAGVIDLFQFSAKP